MAFINQLYNNAGLILLGFFWNDKEVGMYGVVTIVNKIFQNMAVSLLLPLLPVLSRRREENQEKFEETYRRFLKYLFILTIPIGFGIFLFSEDLVLLLYGVEFIRAIPGLKILVWSGVLFPFFNFFIYVNTAVGDQKLNAKFTLYHLISIVSLCLVLVPKLSFIGVCIANLISLLCTIVIFYTSLLKRKIVSFKFKDLPLRQIFASTIMIYVINLLSDIIKKPNIMTHTIEIIALTFIGALVYFVILFITGTIDKYDRMSLKKIILGLYDFFHSKIKNLFNNIK